MHCRCYQCHVAVELTSCTDGSFLCRTLTLPRDSLCPSSWRKMEITGGSHFQEQLLANCVSNALTKYLLHYPLGKTTVRLNSTLSLKSSLWREPHLCTPASCLLNTFCGGFYHFSTSFSASQSSFPGMTSKINHRQSGSCSGENPA